MANPDIKKFLTFSCNQRVRGKVLKFEVQFFVCISLRKISASMYLQTVDRALLILKNYV